MVLSASHFKDVTNGYEKRTDGLWMHTGKLDVRGNLTFGGTNATIKDGGLDDPYTAGQRLVAINALTVTPGALHAARLQVNGPLNVTGAVSLPAGSITSTMLAANAAQGPTGGYLSNPSWSTPAINTWYETPAQVTLTPSVGGTMRCEGAVSVANTTAGAIIFVGIGWNGTVQQSLVVGHIPAASYVLPFSFIYYAYGTFGAGTPVRFAIFLHTNAGVATIASGATTALYITEQKR